MYCKEERNRVMAFKIVRNDITRMQVDAIVNTANSEPVYGDGVDTAIYEAAGVKELLAERRKIGVIAEGDVCITPAFKLPAKYIIHAVSPPYEGGGCGEEELLRSCYGKSLQLAYEYKCESIAFPLIATGSYGYPKEEGIRVAVDEINAFLLEHDMLIYLVVFDNKSTNLGQKLYPKLEAYIDHNYVCDKREMEYGDRYFESRRKTDPSRERYKRDREILAEQEACICRNISCEPDQMSEKELDPVDFYEDNQADLKERMEHLSDTFQQYLFYLIQTKNLSNSAVYKRAIITKQLFSKIKLNENYHPDKSTAMRLCVGATLNLDETKDLLARAGYALSPCDKRDIIFAFFIEHEVFDMVEIDIALEEHGLPCFIE